MDDTQLLEASFYSPRGSVDSEGRTFVSATQQASSVLRSRHEAEGSFAFGFSTTYARERQLLQAAIGKIADECELTSKAALAEQRQTTRRASGDGCWRDCGTPNVADFAIRSKRQDTERPYTTIVARIDTANQVQEALIVRTFPETGSVKGGMPMALEVEAFPEWVPFCRSATLVREWSLTETIARLEFKVPVINIRVTLLAYICMIDRLDEEDACIEVRLCTLGGTAAKQAQDMIAAESSTGRVLEEAQDGQEQVEAPEPFLGVPVPLPTGRLDIVPDVDCSRMKFYPNGKGGLRQEIAAVTELEESMPAALDGSVDRIWRMLARNLLPIAMKRVDKAKPFAVSPSRFRYYQELERRIALASDKAEARVSSRPV